MVNYKTIDFRFASKDDVHEPVFVLPHMWSRPYEYHYVLDFIRLNTLKDWGVPLIHNSSWGFEGVHVTFRDMLDEIGDCLHSDIVKSKFRDTFRYNITKENKDLENKFNFVINISTIEHLNGRGSRIAAIENLFKQVKPGGYLVITFDYPKANLSEIEELMRSKCIIVENALNGDNSVMPNKRCSGLNIVYLVLQKDE